MWNIVILAVLSGWLVGEMKDFITNGGVSNVVAFSLLKICFILCAIVIMIALIAYYYLIPDTIKRLYQKYNTTTPDDDNDAYDNMYLADEILSKLVDMKNKDN